MEDENKVYVNERIVYFCVDRGIEMITCNMVRMVMVKVTIGTGVVDCCCWSCVLAHSNNGRNPVCVMMSGYET